MLRNRLLTTTFLIIAATVGFAHTQHASAVESTKAEESVLYSFCSLKHCTDGRNPGVGLINVNGTLYGTTKTGGAHNSGTVFAVDSNTGAEKVVHSFCSKRLACRDGGSPMAGLIDVNGLLYGTTADGGGSGCGGYGCGVVFSLDPSTGAEKVLHSFCTQRYCPDGEYPYGDLIDVKGTLYGTTSHGGANCQADSGCGTVFSLDPSTGAETVLYSFYGHTDGAYPLAGLISANGTLYGTTFEAGNGACFGFGCGTIFAVDRKTGLETTLYAFCSKQNCSDGKNPFVDLITVDGTLYGTTETGGYSGRGTAFSLDATTGAETVLHSFCITGHPCEGDGKFPTAGLIIVNGILYGTTARAGGHGEGTVFTIDPTTGVETVLYSFCRQQNCSDGANPAANLVNVNGTLYGTTFEGGAYCPNGGGCGTVFALKMP